MNPISLLKDTLEITQLLRDTPPMTAFVVGIVFGGVVVMMLLKYLGRKEKTLIYKPNLSIDKDFSSFYEGYHRLFLVLKGVMELIGKAEKDGHVFMLYRVEGKEKPIIVVPEDDNLEKYEPDDTRLVITTIEEYYKFLASEGLNIALDHGYKKVAEIFFDEVRWF